MIAERSKGLFAIHSALQVLIVVGAFWAWLAIFLNVYNPEWIELSRYAVYCVLTAFALVARAVFSGPSASSLIGQQVGHRLRYAFTQTVWSVVALMFFVMAAKDKSISRVFVFTWIPLLYGILAATNAALPSILARHLFQGTRVESTLLYFTGPHTGRLEPWLERQRAIGIRVVGAVADVPPPESFARIPVLGGTQDLDPVLASSGVTQLIVTELPDSQDQAHRLANLCEARGVRLLVLTNLDAKFGRAVTVVEDAGLEFITLRGEPLESPLNRLLKRTLDIAISAPVVLFLLPVVTAIVWIFQRLQSPGPVLYIQPRAGLQNKPFDIYKYRTMHVDNPDAAVQARRDDDRIYPAGRWFRRLSLDELPQFINVLLGDMSVVGPRPHLAKHNERWAKILNNYHVRTFVKPGITGLAQVRGFRGEATTDEAIRNRVLSDIEYLENWSISLDCLIILRTFTQVFRPPPSAY